MSKSLEITQVVMMVLQDRGLAPARPVDDEALRWLDANGAIRVAVDRVLRGESAEAAALAVKK